MGADENEAGRAGELCKCDLSSQMVGEFPKLQGHMGRLYALHQGEAEAVASLPIPPIDQTHNTAALGNVLYTKYVYLFEAAGLILLVAMIGSIVLTLRQRQDVRRQSIARQVTKKRGDAIEVKDVPSRTGV